MAAPFPIVDAHQHFWDRASITTPWLCDQPPIPFRYGDYSALRRPYLPADYFGDAKNHSCGENCVRGDGMDPRDPLGEMRYVARLRRETGFPTVAVAQAWLDREDLGATLAALSEFAFVRGIRHKPLPGQMSEERWRSGFAQLTRRGLRFDLQAPWAQFAEAALLARDFADATVLSSHRAAADRSRASIAGWNDALRTLAACPNAALKVSGLGRAGSRHDGAIQPRDRARRDRHLRHRRSMFASNFPVDGLCAPSMRSLRGCAGTAGSPWSSSGFLPRQRGAHLRHGETMSGKMKIGYVGVGLMGMPMAKRLLSLGYAVRAYDISPQRIAEARDAGAATASSAADAVRNADLVLVNLPTPEAVEVAVFGENGIASALRPPQHLVDFSTIKVYQCKAFAKRLREMTGVGWIDALSRAVRPPRAAARDGDGGR